MMICIHKNKLTEHNWCKVAGYYCTLNQEMTCDRKVVEKPQANADRIRSMSDEELAQYLAILIADTRDGVAYSTDEDRWFNWLQQPAEECE